MAVSASYVSARHDIVTMPGNNGGIKESIIEVTWADQINSVPMLEAEILPAAATAGRGRFGTICGVAPLGQESETAAQMKTFEFMYDLASDYIRIMVRAGGAQETYPSVDLAGLKTSFLVRHY